MNQDTRNNLVDEFKRRFPGPMAFEAIEASIQASFEGFGISRENAAALAEMLMVRMIQTVVSHAPESVRKDLEAAIRRLIEKN